MTENEYARVCDEADKLLDELDSKTLTEEQRVYVVALVLCTKVRERSLLDACINWLWANKEAVLKSDAAKARRELQ
jgi:hypothetical protein